MLDVAEGEDYYGRKGRRSSGRDASKAFAMMSLKEEDAHADLSGVPDEHLKILDDWYDKLTKKYPTVGRIHFTPAGGTAKREEPADMWDSFRRHGDASRRRCGSVFCHRFITTARFFARRAPACRATRRR